MNKYLKIFLICAVVGLVIGLCGVYYVFHMPHRNLANEKPSFEMTAKSLFDDYSKNEKAGDQKYGNKAIKVNGKVVDVKVSEKDASIVLDDEMAGVICSFDSTTVVNNKAEFAKIKIGQTAVVQGQCDALGMMGVGLTRCVLVK